MSVHVSSETYHATSGRPNCVAGNPRYKMISWLVFSLKTTFLFTRSDYKTLFFPVASKLWFSARPRLMQNFGIQMMSACAAFPPARASQLVNAAVWVWFHLLQFNISDQTYSIDEDIANKPWRPLPSGRISVNAARRFNWGVLTFCLCLSAWHGTSILFSSVTLSVLFSTHNDFGFSLDPFLRNLANVGGYVTFQSGAILLVSSRSHFDRTSLIAFLISGLVVFTTIHAQDFADLEGDTRVGRCTSPIIAPEWSRVSMLVALPLWSIMLTTSWGLGPVSGTVCLCLGLLGVSISDFEMSSTTRSRICYTTYGYWRSTRCL